MASPCAGCAALEEQLTNAELSALEESEKLESEKEAIEDEKSALEGELDRLQAQFDTGHARQLQLEQDGTRARQRNESTRAELETATGKLEAALRKLEAVTVRERDLEQQNDQLEDTSRILQASTEKLEAELEEAIERETFVVQELEDVRLLSEEIEQRSKDEGKELALDRRHIEQQLQEEQAAVERLSSELEATRRRCAIAEEGLGELQAVAEVAAAAGAVAGEEMKAEEGESGPINHRKPISRMSRKGRDPEYYKLAHEPFVLPASVEAQFKVMCAAGNFDGKRVDELIR